MTGERISYTGKMPHITTEMMGWHLPPGTILDGELVSFRGGEKEYFKDIQHTSNGHDLTNAQYQSTTGYYVTWVIFDIVFYNGKEVHKLPYRDRLLILERLFTGQSFKWIRLIKTEPFEGTAEDYRSRAHSLKIEGYVVKNLDSLYPMSSIGNTKRPSGTWWKIKAIKTADVIISGYECGRPGSSVQELVAKLIGHQYDSEGRLHQVCRVGTGFNDWDRQNLLTVNYTKRPIGIVRYFYRSDGLKLIHPSWGGFRNDKTPEECIIEE